MVFSVAPCTSQYMLFPARGNAQRHHQHLLAEMNPVDQDRHQIKFIQFSLAQRFQLCRAGLHELPAHAGLLNPVAVEHALHRPPIVSRGQTGHDPFPHRSLPSPVVLQPRIAIELNFFALPRPHPRSLDGTFTGKHHIARLLAPAQATRRRIRLVARLEARRITSSSITTG